MKSNELDVLVLNQIRKGTRLKPAKTRDLCFDFNINRRTLKYIVSRLREEYPIVSQDINGGGYWLANNNDELITFLNMMENRKKGYIETIDKMTKYLK